MIKDMDDPRLDVYARLTDVQLRSKSEPEQGVLIAESAKVIDRALDAGLQPISLLVGEDQLEKEAQLIERFGSYDFAEKNGDASHTKLTTNAPVLVAPNSELEKLTGFKLTRGALAAFVRPTLPDPTHLLADARRIAVLEDITNHTNVGAIFRNAAALGLDAVLITPGCYDPFYRRAVRVSMGTVFQVPWTRIGGDAEGKAIHGNVARKGGWTQTGIPLLRAAGFKTAAMALSDDSVPIDDPRLTKEDRLAIILGTEGEGLSDNTIAASDHVVRIPMQHGVDSLNVAAASAVAFWQLRLRA